MRIEIVHDALARKIYEKGSSKDKSLLRMLHLVNERFVAYGETKTFLSRQELNFIDPFSENLEDLLDKPQFDFVEKSRSVRRRQLFTVAISMGVFIVSLIAGLLYFNNLRQKAEAARAETFQQSEANRLVALAMQNEEIAPELALKLTLAAKELSDKNSVDIDKLTRLIFRRNNFSNQELVHKGVVYGVAFAPSGQTFATASMDKMIRIWDLEGELKKTLLGHSRMINDVTYSMDGKHLASVADDSTAIIWNVATGNIIKTLKGHKDQVNAVRYSPNGKYLLTGSRDKTAILWTAAGDFVKEFKGHVGPIYGVAFSPFKPEYMATASGDSTVRVWNINTGKELSALKHPSHVHGVVFSPKNMSEIATGCRDDFARIWNINTTTEIKKFEGHASSVINVDYSPSGDTLLTGSWDNTAILWDVTTERNIRTLIGHNDYVLGLAYSPKGRFVVTGSVDNTARIWDLELSRRIKSFEGHTDRVQAVAFSKDLKYCLTGSWDNTAILWDMRTKKMLQKFTFNSDVEAVAFHPSNLAFAVASGRYIYLVNVGDTKPIFKYQGHTKTVKTIKFSQSGDRMLSGGRDDIAIYWDVNKHKIKYILKGHQSDIMSVDFTGNDNLLVTSSWDKTIILWDTTGRVLKNAAGADKILRGHATRIYSVSLSSDSRRLLSSDLGGGIYLWNTEKGTLINSWKTNNSVFKIKFVPNNDNLFVAAGADNQAKLYSFIKKRERGKAQQEEIVALQHFDHQSDVYDLDINEDMSYIFTASQDGKATLFYTLEGFLKSNHFEDITILDKIKFEIVAVSKVILEEKYQEKDIEMLRKLAIFLEEKGVQNDDLTYLEKGKAVHDKILELPNQIPYDKQQAATLYATLALAQLKANTSSLAESKSLIEQAVQMASGNPEVILMQGHFSMIDQKPAEAKIIYSKLYGITYGRNVPILRKARTELNDFVAADLVTQSDFDIVKIVLE